MEPPQWRPQSVVDFRHAEEGPRGYKVAVSSKTGRAGSKRKLEEYAEQVSSDVCSAAGHACHGARGVAHRACCSLCIYALTVPTSAILPGGA